MITKNDCYLLLSELNEKGVDTSSPIKDLMSSTSPSIDVIKFINDNRQLDLTAFYEKIRKSYNNKKSKLYINIVNYSKNKGNLWEYTYTKILNVLNIDYQYKTPLMTENAK